MFRSFTIAIVLVSASIASQAQVSLENISVKGIFGMERREIVSTKIKMSSTDSMSFWPVFDQYEDERKGIYLDRIKLVKSFLSEYSNMTDEEMTELMQAAMDLELNQFKLMDIYYNKFKKNVSAMVVAQWMQLEFYMNLAVKLAWQEKLPFIGDIKLKPLRK